VTIANRNYSGVIVRWMSHEIYAGFARRLGQLCEEKGLPERGRQAELARICNIKPSSVNKWFSAVSLPDAANLLTIADWGRTSVDWLLSGRTHKEAQEPVQEFALAWLSVEEITLVSNYRLCTQASKHLVLDVVAKAEKDEIADVVKPALLTASRK
jgi:transcriptional regulator with XRE-family HTH domain